MDYFVGARLGAVVAVGGKDPAGRVACPIEGPNIGNPAFAWSREGGGGNNHVLATSLASPLEHAEISGHVEVERHEILHNALPHVANLSIAHVRAVIGHSAPSGRVATLKIEVNNSRRARQAFQHHDSILVWRN